MRGDEFKERLLVADALYQCDATGDCRSLVMPLFAHSLPSSLVVEWCDASTASRRTAYMLGADVAERQPARMGFAPATPIRESTSFAGYHTARRKRASSYSGFSRTSKRKSSRLGKPKRSSP
jgi:hypothetical protein